MGGWMDELHYQSFKVFLHTSPADGALQRLQAKDMAIGELYS